jgi:argininosuccinate lyase
MALKELSILEYQGIHSAFEEDLYQVFDAQRSVETHASEGGTAPRAVQVQIEQARALLVLP